MDDPPVYVVPDVLRDQHQPCVSRMYHFSSSSWGRLKDTLSTNPGVQNPTRFEVATALVLKCGRQHQRQIIPGLFKPSLSCHLMNLHPPLPLNTIGNGVHFFNTIAATEDEIQVPHFVAQLRKAKQHLRDQIASRSLMEIILEPAVCPIQTNSPLKLKAQTQPQLLDLSPKELEELAEKYFD
ncbi:hypothetical protein H5410_007829 [Solanum commersonii]|uniref:Uncharacterized protein n=1 Tax=Solanum commersonii TaxID=4109 RepID=A0A9J6AE17_SOLCO|nr:hypothetical protein H5410_007829 [Solanum commersonii]